MNIQNPKVLSEASRVTENLNKDLRRFIPVFQFKFVEFSAPSALHFTIVEHFENWIKLESYKM